MSKLTAPPFEKGQRVVINPRWPSPPTQEMGRGPFTVKRCAKSMACGSGYIVRLEEVPKGFDSAWFALVTVEAGEAA